MAAVRYLGFVGAYLGPPTKSSVWSLSFCKIWLEIGIDAVVAIIRNFQYFVRLARKRLLTPQNLGGFHELGSNMNETFKEHTVARILRRV